MKFGFRALLVFAVVLGLATMAGAADDNWRIKIQADDGSGMAQGTPMHAGVYPTSNDGVDTQAPSQDQLAAYGFDIGQATRWVVSKIEGDGNTWARDIRSPAYPTAYAEDTKQWELHVAALANATDNPIRLRFYTLGADYLPPATLDGDTITYRLVMLDNKGVAGAPDNGTVWDLPIPTADSTDPYYTLPVNLPVIKLSSGTHSAMLAEGYVLALQQHATVQDDPNPPTTVTVAITVPTSQASYTTTDTSLDLAGTASSNVATVSWSSDRGSSGTCSGTTVWSAQDVPILSGDNVITITADDGAGNTATDTLTVTRTETSGQKLRGFGMVSLPVIPTNTDPKQAVGFYNNMWYAYMPQLNTYAAYARDPDHLSWFEPVENARGRGFWAGFYGDVDLPIGTVPRQDEPFAIHLYPGWNLIGNPFTSAVDWDMSAITVQEPEGTPLAIQNATNVVTPYLWGWQQNVSNPFIGSYYLVSDLSYMTAASDQLQPWEGYWILAYAECDLIIPPPAQ